MEWFDREFRDLPWRRTADPYKIWISEIMLQQTQVAKVIPYYNNFLQRFPTVHDLAAADLSDVLKAWEGMGYYSRARNLRKAAQILAGDFSGKFPDSAEEMIKLPGIGNYSAAAIASIAFGRPVAAVDGNVMRVLARLHCEPANPKTGDGKKRFQQLADDLLDTSRPGDFNQAVMELGAVICKPKNPECGNCPVPQHCCALAENCQSAFPYREPAKKRPHKHIAVGIVERNGKILIARRPEDAMLGGLWEFPGGKTEDGETLEQAVVRELREELDIETRVTDFFMKVDHQYTHLTITLHAFFCSLVSGNPRAIGCSDFRWVSRNELAQFAFPKANKVILENLIKASEL